MKPNLAHFDSHESLSYVAERLEKIVIRMKGKIKKSELAADLTTLLNEIRGHNDEPIGNSLIIDRSTFSILYKGKPCDLGNTMAFRLIERLAEDKGIYLDIGTLIRDVWQDKEISEGAVQHQIGTLRKKLRKAGITGIVFQCQPKHYRLILR
jgi:DNA-binding response OmpR family regulator